MNAVQKLRQLVGELRGRPNPSEAKADWDIAARLLGRMPVDASESQRVCAEHDVDGLDALVSHLENPEAARTAEPDAPAPEVSTDDMDRAMRAFRKRLKLMKLSDESRLGNRYTTGGRKSEIDAIMPPNEFPDEVWKALARAGKLKDTGKGFYMLPD